MKLIARREQQTLKNLESAYNRFFKKLSAFPRFKKRSNHQSFKIPQHFSLTVDGKLKIPKMSPINIEVHREIEGEMKSVTISKTPSGKYYAFILVEYIKEFVPIHGNKIGIDLGLKEFVITSNGDKYDNPKYFKQAQQKLKRLQRSLFRKTKGSTSSAKARNR